MRHPDSKNRILLPQCLPATDAVIIDRADSLSQKKLQATGNQGTDRNHYFREAIRRIVQ